MTRYVFSRLVQAVFVVLGVMLMVFLVINLTGDPAAMLMPPGASEDAMALIRQRYGLDKPWPVQLFRFFLGDVLTASGRSGQTIEVMSIGAATVQAKMRPLGGAIRGDFGDSLRFLGQPAMPIVLERFPFTVQLMLAAAAYSTVLSLILGTVSSTIVADVEDRFSVSIPNDVLSDIATVDDIAKALVKLQDQPQTSA